MKVYVVGDYDGATAVFSDKKMAEAAANEFMIGDYVDEYEVDEYVHIIENGIKMYEVLMDVHGKLVYPVNQRILSPRSKFKNNFEFGVRRYGHTKLVRGMVFTKTEDEAIEATEQYRLEHIRLDSEFA